MIETLDTVGHASEAAVVVMTAGGSNPWMIINHLKRHFHRVEVIQERPESKRMLFQRRANRFGAANAFGQLVTMVLSKLGKRLFAERLDAIAEEFGLSPKVDPSIPIHSVTTLNDPDCHDLVHRLEPTVIVTLSCRILSRTTLSQIACPVINLHCGVNPAYRGQMGGYWALVCGDEENFGTTVHLVDAGVDTGAVLEVVLGRPTRKDTMLTYPALQTALGADALVRAVAAAFNGELKPSPPPAGRSRLWFNVPAWTWLYIGMTRGIW